MLSIATPKLAVHGHHSYFLLYGTWQTFFDFYRPDPVAYPISELITENMKL
jgi:hypothetical protein